MKNNATRTIRSEEITIDVRICAALAANRGGEVYLAAIAPDMELTVITLDEAPGILPCFEGDDACLNLPNTSLLLCYNPAQVLKVRFEYVLLSIVGCISDGPTAALIASSAQWKTLINIGLLMGVLAGALGNYVGIGVAYAIRAFIGA